MDIYILICNKILFIGFFISFLMIIREVVLFIKHLMEPEPHRYLISTTRLVFLGFSLALILTAIFNKITL